MSLAKGSKLPTSRKARRYLAPDRFILEKDRIKPIVFVAGGKIEATYGERLVELRRMETEKFIKVCLVKQ